MAKNINDSINEMDETMKKLDSLMDSRMEDSSTAMKKGIVQTVIWTIATIAIYFIWGTTWYFWVGFVLSIVMIGAMVFGTIMISKTKKLLEKDTSISSDYEEDDIEEEEEEEIVYTEAQKILVSLMNELENIGEEHGELYDTECREQMSEVVFSAFILEKENYLIPESLGFYSDEGNKVVKNALNKYLIQIAKFSTDSSSQERMDMFQDADIYSAEYQSIDDFFGWMDELPKV